MTNRYLEKIALTKAINSASKRYPRRKLTAESVIDSAQDLHGKINKVRDLHNQYSEHKKKKNKGRKYGV